MVEEFVKSDEQEKDYLEIPDLTALVLFCIIFQSIFRLINVFPSMKIFMRKILVYSEIIIIEFDCDLYC